MYQVVNWDTEEIISEHKTLAAASRKARGQGHTGKNASMFSGYSPVAFVRDESGACVYNPRFSKSVSAQVGGFIDSIPGGSL
jgi:hypothetical protein